MPDQPNLPEEAVEALAEKLHRWAGHSFAWSGIDGETHRNRYRRDAKDIIQAAAPAIRAAAVEEERARVRSRLARPKGLLEGTLSQVQSAMAKRDINRGGLEGVLAEVIAALAALDQEESDD